MAAQHPSFSMRDIGSFKQVDPKIYAYTLDGVPGRRGKVKVGQTKRDAIHRMWEQTHTAGLFDEGNMKWTGPAYRINGDGELELFSDHDLHRYMRFNGIEFDPGTEWAHTDPDTARKMYDAYVKNSQVPGKVEEYTLRPEQSRCVEALSAYYRRTRSAGSKDAKFLINAKPRFGKTLTVYDFLRTIDAHRTLIVTNRPSVGTSWQDDYARFFGPEFAVFVSRSSSVSGRKWVVTPEEYAGMLGRGEDPRVIVFASLQDLKGARDAGGRFEKWGFVFDTGWDVLVVDESHEGVDTKKTGFALRRIKRDMTLYLSGTPFRQIASGEFAGDEIFNWLYPDEQRAKREFDEEKEGRDNPYADLPTMHLMTYRMSDMMAGKVERGADIDGERHDYAFDLNEFFRADPDTLRFVHEDDVKRFLDALSRNEKYPFSTIGLRRVLRHTLWLFDRVASAKAMERLLREHPVFGNGNYKVVIAAGDGKAAPDEQDDFEADELADVAERQSYDRVMDAIADNDKTITLSVGQLTTGVTVRPWTGVLMLSNIRSAALYMQAAFRAQSPYTYASGKTDANGVHRVWQKTDCYVFDFCPERTLELYARFANDLHERTAGGGGTREESERNVRELLNFLPVVAEDMDGVMGELDAERVLSLPRRIKSVSVVNHGFMDNNLFPALTGLFSEPAVERILSKVPVPIEDRRPSVPLDGLPEVNINDEGEVEATEEGVERRRARAGLGGPYVFGAPVSAGAGDGTGVGDGTGDGTGGVDGDADDTTQDPGAGDLVEFEEAEDEDPDDGTVTGALDETYAYMIDMLDSGEYSDAEEDELIESCTRSVGDMLRGHAEDALMPVAEDDDTGVRARRGAVARHVDAVVEEAEDGGRERDIAIARAREARDEVLGDESASEEERRDARKTYGERLRGIMGQWKERVAEAERDSLEREAEALARERAQIDEERKARETESGIRDHLRGFSRSIPLFIMAYGTVDKSGRSELCLANFHEKVDPVQFREVTSISMEEFCFLRDGGDIEIDNGDGTTVEGHLDHGILDEQVFDDAVQVFLDKEEELRDWWVSDEDIFSYIPPQRSSMIFTPRRVVSDMLDRMEAEEPGVFDDENRRFADLYVKSGLFLVGIAKRLFASPVLSEKYPDEELRKRHILIYQIWACAPTEPIYRIAHRYIYGVLPERDTAKSRHMALLDTARSAKEGTLQEDLDRAFPEMRRICGAR